MVRLRREIEGIAIDPAAPLPAYALDSDASRLVLPQLDAHIRALEPGRLLIAGLPTIAWVQELADAGHKVTVSDVPRDEVAAFMADLSTNVATKLTLIDKPYGQAAFSPSSFNNVLLLDTLHRFAEPKWVAQKAFRELKFDGHFICRVWARGAGVQSHANGEAHGDSDQSGGAWPTRSWQSRLLAAAEPLCRSRWSAVVLDAAGRDAVDRGAHLGDRSFGCPWRESHEAMVDKLSHLQTFVGSSQRFRAAQLLYGARGPARQLLLRAIEGLAEAANDADTASGAERALGMVWRKELAHARFGR